MAAGIRGPGFRQNLFRNSGTYGVPVWVAMTSVRDVMLNLDKSKVEVKARLMTWGMNLPGIKTGPLEFDIIADTSLAEFNILRDAYINDTVVDLAVSDSAAMADSGSDYFRADYYVFGFPVDQKLEEVETVKLTCDLAYSATHIPAWTDVA